MSILDTIKDKVAGGVHEGQTMRMVSQLVTDSGGIDGLVEKFTAAGFGDTVKSWLSPGVKRPISSDQVQKVLGPSQIQSLASKFGMDSSKVSSELASQLPKLLDKFSH